MALTMKYYTMIAEAINKGLAKDENMIDVLCDAFQRDNPKFNRDRFIAACIPAELVEAEFTSKWGHIKRGDTLELREKLTGISHIVTVLDVEPAHYSDTLVLNVDPQPSPGISWVGFDNYEWRVLPASPLWDCPIVEKGDRIEMVCMSPPEWGSDGLDGVQPEEFFPPTRQTYTVRSWDDSDLKNPLYVEGTFGPWPTSRGAEGGLWAGNPSNLKWRKL